MGRIEDMASAITQTKEKFSSGCNGILSPALSLTPGEARGELRDRSKVRYPRRPVWVIFRYPIDSEGAAPKNTALENNTTNHITELIPTDWETDFTPRTVLAKMLVILREKAIAAGMKLLSIEEVHDEVKRRRGEIEEEEIEEGEIEENETDLS